MIRREFIALAGAAVAWPLVARAQQKAMPLIGHLSAGTAPSSPKTPFLDAFRQELGESGYVEGQNLVIEYRYAEGHYDRLPALAADLVGRKVDLIVAAGGTPTARAAKNATSTIPIVFTGVGDPVAASLAASLSRPGGNLTGFNDLTGELTPKRVELLCELVPRATVVARHCQLNRPRAPFCGPARLERAAR